MSAELLMLMGGLTAFLLTLYWVRSRDLREKYAVMWICAASIVLLCGIFPEAIEFAARRAHLAYPTAVLFISLAAIYIFSFTVSVSLTHQHRRNIRLMQELAIMEQRLRMLEEEVRKRS
ncbi:MAG TPA: DUF2304 domain-containing protein [Planctomycetota bacterium]|nr:DUF2304 domain-containing protein [Planctomycetota bacterium]